MNTNKNKQRSALTNGHLEEILKTSTCISNLPFSSHVTFQNNRALTLNVFIIYHAQT
jgi:hypothetical protein